MKELSIEEKAKRYDEALENAKNLIKEMNEKGFLATDEEIRELFFKLKESEDKNVDEKVRKALIKLVTNHASMDLFIEYDIHLYEALSWLEKQGKENSLKGTLGDVFDDLKFGLDPSPKQDKQKPILDVEIPFGAKDSELEEVSYSIPNGYHAEIEDNKVIIKKGEQKPVEPTDLKTWKYIVDAVLTEREGIGQYLDSPWTTEVAEKLQKRFGNIEQNPIESNEAFNNFVRWFVGERTKNYTLIPSDEDIQRWSNMILEHARNVLNNEQGWSEEDYNVICSIIQHFEGLLLFEKDTSQAVVKMYYYYIDRLNYLKNRFLPQPKQEWSEEDEKVLNNIIHLAENHYYINVEERDWLKSLRQKLSNVERNGKNWKPSEEELNALDKAWSGEELCQYDRGILNTLFGNLKALLLL